MQTWNAEQLDQHRQAAHRLDAIMTETWEMLKSAPRSSERAVQRFIERRFRHYGLRSAHGRPIVAFGAGAAEPHHETPTAKSAVLTAGDAIKIDIWGRLREPYAPFADITWMGYAGPSPSLELSAAWQDVAAARDTALAFVRERWASGAAVIGRDADNRAHGLLKKAGRSEQILHTLGHSLGIVSPHGHGPHLSQREERPLIANLGYTIEPGVYLPGKFGVRSELSFLLLEGGSVEVTTALQKKLVAVSL